MIDLGKHALPVLSAYGITILLLVVLVLASLHRARHISAELRKLEKKTDD